MCTRFSFVVSAEKMRRQFNLPLKADLQQSYNIGAGQNAYLLTNQAPELQIFRWGLIPHWAKDEGVGANLINAMSEGIETKHSFRIPIRQHRCLVFADSYYEWRRDGRNVQPYRVMYDDSSILAFAGVWDVWTNPINQQTYKTFAILTVPANKEVRQLSSRMPVLLRQPAEWVQWLGDATLQDALRLLQTPADGILHYYPVSKNVDALEHNYPELHEAIKLPPPPAM